jgi:hypothetical protein
MNFKEFSGRCFTEPYVFCHVHLLLQHSEDILIDDKI